METNEILSFSAQQRINSLQIAEVVGKPHNDVMKAIRKMEPAWTKVAQGNFSLGSYYDKNGQLRPCYSLTKRETLFIATKFNDEARAQLILYCEYLEDKVKEQMAHELARKDADANYCREVLESHGTMTATEIAKQLGMSARMLNLILHQQGVIFKQSRTWFPYAEYQDKGLTDYETRMYVRADGRTYTRRYLRWTEKGQRFIMERVASRQQRCLPVKPRYVELTLQFTI